MEHLKIRKAQPQDFETIYEFINSLENQIFDNTRQKEIFLTNIKKQNNIYLVAAIVEDVAGFVSCHIQNLLHHGGLIAEIQEMYVDPAWQGKRVGTALLNELKAIVKKRKVLQLEVTSNKSRAMAHHFYEREQFNYTSKKFVFEVK